MVNASVGQVKEECKAGRSRTRVRSQGPSDSCSKVACEFNTRASLPPPSDPATTATSKLQGAARTHAATPSKHNGFICLQSGRSHSPDAKALSHYTNAIHPRYRAAVSKGSLVSPRHSPWGAVVAKRNEARRVQRQSGNVLGQSDATVWTSQKFTAQPHSSPQLLSEAAAGGVDSTLAGPYSCGNRKHRIALLNVDLHSTASANNESAQPTSIDWPSSLLQLLASLPRSCRSYSRSFGSSVPGTSHLINQGLHRSVRLSRSSAHPLAYFRRSSQRRDRLHQRTRRSRHLASRLLRLRLLTVTPSAVSCPSQPHLEARQVSRIPRRDLDRACKRVIP